MLSFKSAFRRSPIPLSLIALLPIVTVAPSTRADSADAVYLTDLSRCEPASALSAGGEPDTWRLLPYATDEGSGTLIHAHSFSAAPNLTLPLDATGWHRISLGIWQPNFAYDGETALRVKLTEDAAFRRIHPPKSADTQTDTYIREIFLREADLTGQQLVIGKMSGLIGRNASLAYVKLEPLSPEDVARIEADRVQSGTRNLTATIDALSYFHYGEYTQPADVLDLIEPYRHSDVAKVLWAVTYGDRTGFPTKTLGATFLGDHNRSVQTVDAGANDYIRGEQQVHRSLRDFAAQGALPHVLAAKHAHEMGVEFDLMIRLGILGGLGFLDLPEEGFLETNPHCRQVLADGTIIDKASFAFEETQDFTVALIREALANSDADGINLCFVRGPQFLQFETPILDTFQERYGEDARSAPADDPRLAAVRTEFMTRFVQKVHTALEDIGSQRGRPVNLSVWVWPGSQGVWLGGTPAAEGLDVAGWIRNGWLDSVICQEGIDPDYIALGKEHECEFVLFTGYRGEKAMSPASVTAAYAEGVRNFAYWDIDAVQILPYHWNWLRRIGHREEMADWESYQPKDRLVRMKSVAGINVDRGLRDAVYSGG